MTNSKHRLIAVVGPTGSGKTKLAVVLAKEFDGVLVSADSRQVYAGLDVGTNKEGAPDQSTGKPRRMIGDIAQLLVDIAQPGERFTLADWLEKAKYTLEHIFDSGKVPIVVGGTGLYVTALLEGYQPGEGRYAKRRRPVDFEALTLTPLVERKELYRRSDERCRQNFDKLLTEIRRLLGRGVDKGWLLGIGLDYRYATLHLDGKLGYDEAIAQLQTASRAYIRRQLTWWRHHGTVISVPTEQEAKKIASEFLKPGSK